jgi:electron transfer flavoprotein alpha subunit
VGVAVESGQLQFTRPRYGGNVRETISFTTLPAVATIKAGVGTAAPDASRKGTIVPVTAPVTKARTRVISREREESRSARLKDAKIIVAGGRGLDGPDGFRILEELAGVLGAVVASSRVPCDLVWCPHSWQIGLTGKTVTPELYLAVGISGAGHHMASCGNAKTIVAINTDPDAAIFKEARFGVVGDYRKIVPALVRAVSELKANP